MSERRPASLGRAGVVVGVASGVANVLGFAALAVLSRAFDPAAYGEIAALLGLGAIGAVPSIAVQLLIAREVAADRGPAVLSGRAVLGLGGALATLVLVSTPVIEGVLHVSSSWSVFWLGLTLVPFTVAGGLQGHLLGAERFGTYAAGLVLFGASRLATSLVSGAVDLSVSWTLATLAVLTTLATLLLSGLTRAQSWWRSGQGSGWLDNARPFGVILSGTGAFMVLSGLDLLLARHFLSGSDSGLYAVGNLFTKAGLWGPQFVAIVVFPRLSSGSGGPALMRRAAMIVVALGVAGTALVATLGPAVIRTVSGESYGAVASEAWLFAVLGILFALVHLLLLGSLAARAPWVTWCIWLAALVEVVLVATVGNDSTAAVLSIALAVTASLVVIGLVGLRSRDPDVLSSDVALDGT